MHGLINHSIQSFVCINYGRETWAEVASAAGLGFREFEPMLTYPDEITPRVLDRLAEAVQRPREEIMEDIGTHLVTHPDFEAVRRLLRFSGDDFEDFLHSLDDLPDRARLAVSELKLPKLELREPSDGQFRLVCEAKLEGFGHVMMGILRVMADDYGALALLDHEGSKSGWEILSIALVATDFAEGRSFDLAASTL